MSKFIRRVIFTLLLPALISLSACSNSDANNTSAPIQITAADFTEGKHTRDDKYAAAFSIKSVSLGELGVSIEASIFDETAAPKLAERIAADYAAACEVGESSVQSPEVYIVRETNTGKPVMAEGQLFCSAQDVESGAYLPYLAGMT